MTTAAANPASAVRISRKQILSLIGLFPLSVYVVAHLWTNMYSVLGPKAFDDRLEASRTQPAFLLLEIFGLALPIVAHTISGLIEITHARPNNVAYNFFDNLKYVLMRASALGVLLFLGAHVVKARILPAMNQCEGVDCKVLASGATTESWLGMQHAFSEEPITLVVYALGCLGISFHLANGYYTAAMRWGLVVSDAGRRRMTYVSAGILVVLVGMSAIAILGFQPFGIALFGDPV